MTGRPAVLMSPVSFMQKPARWMQLLAGNSSAFTAAPNFAFELAVRRTSDDDMAGLDLGGVVVIINGAERVHGATVRRFNERFAAVQPARHRYPAVLRAGRGDGLCGDLGRGRPPTAVRFDNEKLAAGHAERCDDGRHRADRHAAHRGRRRCGSSIPRHASRSPRARSVRSGCTATTSPRATGVTRS